MGMTERDKKLLIGFALLVLLGGYWMLILGPKRSDLSTAQTARDEAVTALEDARAAVVRGEQTKQTFRTSYARVVRLGKAVPADDDVPGIILQIGGLAEQSNIDFGTVTIAEGGAAPVLPTTTGGATGPTGDAAAAAPSATPATGGAPATAATSAAPAAAGTGSTARTGVGRTIDKAEGARDAADARGQATAGAGDAATPATPPPTATDLAAAASGLLVVTYSLEFEGSFFDLHRFFGKINNLVVRREGDVAVRGRLFQITSLELNVSAFPKLKATVQMNGYKLPRGSSASAGATPASPPGAALAGGTAPTGAAPAGPPAATVAPSGVGR